MGRKKNDSTGTIIGVGIAAGIGLILYNAVKGKGVTQPAAAVVVPPPTNGGGAPMIIPDAGTGGKDPVVKTTTTTVTPPAPPSVDTNPWTKPVIDPITQKSISVDEFIRKYTQEDVKAKIADGTSSSSTPIYDMAMAAGLKPSQIIDRMAVGSPTTKKPTENLSVENKPTQQTTTQTKAAAVTKAATTTTTVTKSVVDTASTVDKYGNVLSDTVCYTPGKGISPVRNPIDWAACPLGGGSCMSRKDAYTKYMGGLDKWLPTKTVTETVVTPKTQPAIIPADPVVQVSTKGANYYGTTPEQRAALR